MEQVGIRKEKIWIRDFFYTNSE